MVLPVIMKCLVLLSLVSLSLSAPFPPAPQAIPYGALAGYPFVSAQPYGALALNQAGGAAPVLAYNAAPYVLNSALLYPEAEAYVHDATGDVSDDSYPEAEAYVHDTSGDA